MAEQEDEDEREAFKLSYAGAIGSTSLSEQENIDEVKHSCGAKINARHRFCYECGATIVQELELVENSSSAVEFENEEHSGQQEEIKGYETSSTDEEAVPHTRDEAETKMNSWKQQKIKFCTVGRSDLGKSTFINNMFMMKPGDKSYAKTGCGNSTMTIKEYVHPIFKNFIICDTPGYGTLKVKKNDFLHKMDLKSFDFVFIFFNPVLGEDELWIAKKLSDLKVPFCFVRCKLDILIEHDGGRNAFFTKQYPAKENKSRTEKLRKEIISKVEKERKKIMSDMEKEPVLKDSNLFLISNIKGYFEYGDWVKLLTFVSEKVSNIQLEALFFYLPVLSPGILYIKYEQLKKRIKTVAVCAGAFAALPVPLVDIPITIGIVVNEVRTYRAVFGLNSDYYKKANIQTEKSIKEKVKVGLAMAARLGFAGVGAGAGALVAKHIAMFAPIVGGVVEGPITGIVVANYLQKTLDETHEEALELYNNFCKEVNS